MTTYSINLKQLKMKTTREQLEVLIKGLPYSSEFGYPWILHDMGIHMDVSTLYPAIAGITQLEVGRTKDEDPDIFFERSINDLIKNGNIGSVRLAGRYQQLHRFFKANFPRSWVSHMIIDAETYTFVIGITSNNYAFVLESLVIEGW
jgi:hypothetical protein